MTASAVGYVEFGQMFTVESFHNIVDCNLLVPLTWVSIILCTEDRMGTCLIALWSSAYVITLIIMTVLINFMISNEIMSIRIKLNFYFVRLISPSFLVKMFELHIEAFHPYKVSQYASEVVVV